jgi:class 3 adenylate cyclase
VFEEDAMAALPTGTVTFLLTDVEGSTRLWEQHTQAMEVALKRHDALATELIHQHGGAVVKHRGEGDSLFAVFVRASYAVTAACSLQQQSRLALRTTEPGSSPVPPMKDG